MYNHMIQLLRGPNVSVTQEYLFGVLSKGGAFPSSQTCRYYKPQSQSFELRVLHVTDKIVRENCEYPDACKNLEKEIKEGLV